MTTEALRKGDIVEVRSPAEILATLDENGALEQLPFNPEMVDYCGRRFTVERRTEKICDTVNWTGSRRLASGVMLDDLRCNGSGHDACQAQCRLIWKESWLRKVDATAPPAPVSETDRQALLELTMRKARYNLEADGKVEARWRCQATELPRATTHLRLMDPRSYVREFTCGNVPFERFIRITAKAAIEEPMRKIGVGGDPRVTGRHERPVVTDAPLHLKPGDLVKVKSKEEIALTLDKRGYNRGLWFDREMIHYCGQTYRVQRRITKFVDDRNGKMIELKSDAVTLEGVVCTGDHVQRRWFCPRHIYPYWRECWLTRAESPVATDV